MAINWFIYAMFLVVMDAYNIYLTKEGKEPLPGGYLRAVPSLLLGLVILYGSIVEGAVLAYAILALGLWNLGFGFYEFSKMQSSKFSTGGLVFSSIISLLIIYSGWQRYSALTPTLMTAGRRRKFM